MKRRGDGIYQRGSAWRLDFVHQGRRYHLSLGRGISRSVAKEIAAVRRAQILRGEAGIGGKRKDMAFKDAIKVFLAAKAAAVRPNTFTSYEQCLDRLEETFGADIRLSQITPFLIEKHRQRRMKESLRRNRNEKVSRVLDRAAPVAFNREVETLRTLFNSMTQWGKFGGPNPAARIKKNRETRGRDRFLSDDEEQRLLAVCEEPLRTIIMAGMYAGLRIPSETLGLQWCDVDLRDARITVPATFSKTGKTRTVPMNSTLRDAFQRLRDGSTSDFVFAKADGQPYTSIQTIFETACRRAKLTGITPHIAGRHTFASRLGMAGVDIRTIQELGGWADINMVVRYASLNPRHKAEAVERIAKKVPTLFTPPAESEPEAPAEVSR